MSRIDTAILPERPVTMTRIKTDICIIGAGSGGLSVAAGAVQMGADVVLLEGHLMGGDCLNFGCVPSKALLAAGHKAHDTAEAAFGVAGHTPDPDYAGAKDHVRAVIDEIAPVAQVDQFSLEIVSPAVLAADEPAAGLSPTERSELIEILLGLPAHMGFIIIEHDMDVALRVAESVTMMHNGRIFKEGSPAEIEDDPEVQALYLGGDDG